jgi:hypothetical protein
VAEPVGAGVMARVMMMPAVMMMVPVVVARDRTGRHERDKCGAGDDGE